MIDAPLDTADHDEVSGMERPGAVLMRVVAGRGLGRARLTRMTSPGPGTAGREWRRILPGLLALALSMAFATLLIPRDEPAVVSTDRTVAR